MIAKSTWLDCGSSSIDAFPLSPMKYRAELRDATDNI